MPRFHIDVNGDEVSAIDRSATLLALACSMRGDKPADYVIHVPAHNELVSRVTGKAEELLRLGHGLFTSVPLSPRENEVLVELLRNSVNKEIASRLRISVRTVKFHVSSLLAKFGVQSRWDLTQKASQILGSCSLVGDTPLSSSPPAQDRSMSEHTTPTVEQNLRTNGHGRVIPFERRLRHA